RAAVQGPRAERRAPAAGIGARRSAGIQDVHPENQLTEMLMRMPFSTTLLSVALAALPAFDAAALAQPGPRLPRPVTPMVPAAPPMPLAPPSPPAPPMPAVPAIAALAFAPGAADEDDRADDLYEHARDLIEEGRFDRAIPELDRLIALNSARTDSAYYWKAYSQAKLGQRADSLATISELTKRFPYSRWLKDARALEVEVRQSSGQTVSPSSQEDDELKLMALRGLMQSDPEQAMPVIEKMLAGANSPKVKERALFVLS